MSHAEDIANILREDSFALSHPGDQVDTYRVIARQELSSGRWSRWDLVVIKAADGSLWGWEDESPLTEMQEVETRTDFTVYPVRATQVVSYIKA